MMYTVTMCYRREDKPVASFPTLAAAYRWAVRYAGPWYISHRLRNAVTLEASWNRVR